MPGLTCERIRFLSLPLAGVEAMSACSLRQFPRHTHEQFGIGVVDAGGHGSWSGRGYVEAGPGQFICVNPGEVHDGRAIGHAPRAWRILYLDSAVMSRARADVLEGKAEEFTFAAPVFVDSSVRPLFEAVFAHAHERRGDGGAPQSMSCETTLLELIARLGAHSARPGHCAPGTPPDIGRIRERMDDDPAAPLRLSDLAKEAGLSRYQLIRGFAHTVGMTPHAYLLQRRVALARRLIRRGLPLADVAASSGFHDQSHLTRCFVRWIGVTPGQYARAH